MIAKGSEAEAQANEEIVALVDAAVRFQSDPAPFLELHAEDVVVVNIAGRRVSSRAELGEAMRAALASPLADVTTTVEVEEVHHIRPGVAIVSCTKHVRDDRAGSFDALPAMGALTYVVVRTDGRWEIALAQTTPVRT